MVDLPTPLEAWSLVAARIRTLDAETVPLAEALDRHLANDLSARWDLPRADLSAMDGFAYQGDLEPGTELSEIGEIPAGASDLPRVDSGQAVAIMTGGWVPQGADRVIPVEATRRQDERRITIDRPVEAGANIRRRAEVHRAGQVVVAAGRRLDAVHLGVAASEGIAQVEVVRRPRLGLLVTGNEVLAAAPDGDLPAGVLLDSHTPLVTGLCREFGLELRSLGIGGDDRRDLAARLEDAELDVLITTGGVSAGRYDLVPETVEDLGYETLVHRVGMQPGKPILIGRRDRSGGSPQWVIGLPGNPAAVFVGFHLFVVPLVRTLAGCTEAWERSRCRVESEVPMDPHRLRTRYLPAVVTGSDATRRARPRIPVGSHDLGAFAGAQVLLEVEPGEQRLAPGTVLEAISVSARH